MAKSLREAAAERRRKRREGTSASADTAPAAAALEAVAPEPTASADTGVVEEKAELPRRKKHERPLDLDNPYAPPRVSLDEGAPRSKRRAALFAVPTGKMVVMSITTCGLYELYWFYKNWQVVLREGRQVSPLGRAIFSPIFAYSMFKRIRDEAVGAGINSSLPPGLLAIMTIVGHLFSQVPGAAWLGLIGIVPSIAANATARATNQALDVGSDEDDKFSAWNIIAATLGGIVLLVGLAAHR